MALVACSSSSTATQSGTPDAGPDVTPITDAGSDASAGSLEATIGEAGLETFPQILRAALQKSNDEFTITAAKGNPRVFVHFQGAAAGTFACNVASVEYDDGAGSTFNASRDFEGTDCTVTIDAIGAVGENVKGTFSGTMRKAALGPADTTKITGSFQVVRQPDD